jgi:PAS domain S-box-containing protein
MKDSLMSEFNDSASNGRTSHEQQAETEALFNSIGDGAISTDEFGHITRVNPAAQHLLGYSEAELLGGWFPKKIVALSADELPVNLIDRPITKAFLTGKPISEKTYYRCKNGQKLPVAINVSPILLDDKPLGAIEVFRDITLEQEVDRMKSEFISLASHQLRTPLSAIKTYTHMLFDGYMGELNLPQSKALSTIISASNRMNELISTLLSITRMESGTIAITPKQVQLDQVVREVFEELSLIAASKSIKLSLVIRKPKTTVSGKPLANRTDQAIPGHPLTIITDVLILKEILTNLVSNALKYTPDDGRVTVRLRPRKASLLIEIIDTGWGIPKYSQDQVFSKFFRAGNIVKRETTGTGLGLYLVKGLLDSLGGTIWFTSEEGEGTTFSFSLPRQPAKQSLLLTNIEGEL